MAAPKEARNSESAGLSCFSDELLHKKLHHNSGRVRSGRSAVLTSDSFASTLRATLPTLCTKVLFEPSLPSSFADMGESRVMKLRFPGTCATCGAALGGVSVPGYVDGAGH